MRASPARTTCEKVNRTVYQAFLTALVLALGVLAPVGYFLSPTLLDLVNATPAVKAEALPFLRMMFVFSIGMLMFFMLGGALRSAGDARTPLRLGIWMTVLNIAFNVVLIPGYGPMPALGVRGAAIGTVSASLIVSSIGLWMLLRGKLVVHFPASMSKRPDWGIIRSLFRFGLPAGMQGVAMNVAGVLLLRFIGSLPHSAEAQAAYAVGYAELFSLITWTSVGLMGAAAAVAGQNLGAGQPERAMRGVAIAARLGVGVAAIVGALFLLIPEHAARDLRSRRSDRRRARPQLLRYLAVSGLLHHRGADATPADCKARATRAVPSTSRWSHRCSCRSACAGRSRASGRLDAAGVWSAIVLGHFTRCACRSCASGRASGGTSSWNREHGALIDAARARE